MISKINTIRRSLIPVSFLILLVFQAAAAGKTLDMGKILFFFAGDLFFFIVTYAFRGFEAETLSSRPATLFSFFVGTLITAIPAILVILLSPLTPGPLPLIVSGVFALAPLPLFCSWMFRRNVAKLPPRKCLIIGKRGEIEGLAREVTERLFGRMEVLDYMNPSAAALEKRLSGADGPIPETIVIADPALAEGILPIIRKAGEKRLDVQYFTDLAEGTLKRIPLALLEKFPDYYRKAFADKKPAILKRVFDICFSVLFLLVSFPLSLFLFLAIPLSSGFPVIFSQPRIGLGMRPFMFYKFRSLKTVNQEEASFKDNPNATIQQRVTGIGNVIRKFRLDEIPQFFNVLLNDMSVIGPRPEMETYHEKALGNIPWYDKRYLFKPGITGWAQINYKHTTSIDDYLRKTEYDLYYVKNWSLKLDFEIALKTVQTMIGMKGAV